MRAPRSRRPTPSLLQDAREARRACEIDYSKAMKRGGILGVAVLCADALFGEGNDVLMKSKLPREQQRSPAKTTPNPRSKKAGRTDDEQREAFGPVAPPNFSKDEDKDEVMPDHSAQATAAAREDKKYSCNAASLECAKRADAPTHMDVCDEEENSDSDDDSDDSGAGDEEGRGCLTTTRSRKTRPRLPRKTTTRRSTPSTRKNWRKSSMKTTIRRRHQDRMVVLCVFQTGLSERSAKTWALRKNLVGKAPPAPTKLERRLRAA